ncbi:MAG TPA: sensor histidine kinase [Kofleriaceae bacterium]
MTTLHQLIETHKDEILLQWTNRMIESAFAEGLSVNELVGVMPEYLSSLGGETAADPSQLDMLQRELVERHLASRLRQGATLNEILSEFATLSRCVASTLDHEPKASQPSTRDAARMFTEVHAACVSSMRIFNEQLLEDEQTMKRYLRLLQRAADHGGELADGRRPLRPLLEEALGLIGRALGAPAAALHLHDTRTGKQIASAASGVAADALEAQVSSMAGAERPAAASDRAVAEVEYASLEVGEVLRASGVDALVEVRPPPRHALRCTLYVGAARGRSFLPHEIRLAESLGEALLIHLDHAQLCSALVARAAEASAECQLRERFVSILMHDLAGPLAAARAGVDGLADLPGASDAAATIGHELDRVAEMVGGLVDAHHIRAGHRLPIHIEACDLTVLAREVIEELRAVHGDRFLLRGNRVVSGMWSADQLRRAIWNLGENAIKFGADEGAVIITVKRRDGGAELAVNNQGPEIALDDQAALFDPFRTARAGRAHPPGWGLGLTLVWGCAESHGGGVDVESSERRGTTFRLRLPYDARPYAD